LDETVSRLREAAPVFARLTIPERIRIARSMQAGYVRLADTMVAAACAAKGINRGGPLEGEEWALGPWCAVRHFRLAIESLASLEKTGNTRVGPTSTVAGGQTAVRVFPAGRIDGMLFAGQTVDVHLKAGIDARAMHDSRAGFYRLGAHDGRTVLVLGAGNVASIPPMDVTTKLFNEGKVCLLKMNPVNAYLGPFLEEAFAEAIARNFLGVVYGGAEEGEYLAQHQGIDEVHLTGSDRTYDQIVWGPPGPATQARKAEGRPRLNKPVTAELGNVSPVLVVPGPYTPKQVAFQAEMIAGAVTNNASFNCNSAKMVMTPKGWGLRDMLLDRLEQALGTAATRVAYYPGAEARWQQLTRGRRALMNIGAEGEGRLPWTLMPGLDAADASEPAFSTEPFCSIVSETEIGSTDPIEFLDRAVDFANNRLWGTLSAQLVVHPRLMKDPRTAEAVERAITRLRYGAVAVNTWPAFVYAYGTPPWGAHPTSTPTDIQSGSGWVHNSLMIEPSQIEKAVLRHPITVFPKPAIFPTHRTAHKLLRRLSYFEESLAPGKLPGVLSAAMRG
jgi:aldehyde dehydrogenase (NAD(P)+)